MNAILQHQNTNKPFLQGWSADFCMALARRRGLQRMLQALFREGFLNPKQIITEGAISWLPLWSQQALLRMEGLRLGRINDCELSGQLSWYKNGETPRTLSSAAELLTVVSKTLGSQIAAGDLQRLLGELGNSMQNDALCQHYRRQWGQELAQAIRDSGHTTLIAMLRQAPMQSPMQTPSQSHPYLLLEQWGSVGHPFHPGHKSKLGLSEQEVLAFSPEFHPQLHLLVAAIKREKAHVSLLQEGDDYPRWFASHFPDAAQAWEKALRLRQQDPQAWLPLPLHPYQAGRVIPEKFAAEISEGDLLLMPEVRLAASPTMSLRTVAPIDQPLAPHLKLPLSVQLTSAQRTVSPRACVMGPRVTRLLQQMLTREAGFGGSLDILGEETGLHYIDPNGNDDRARHLAVLFRCNPASKSSAELFPIPVGTLFADTPVDGRALVTELVALAYGDHAEAALQFFAQYAHTVLTATLSAYLLYGIAFEAHQQNSIIMLNPAYQPVQLLLRDFGDLRIHAPSLRRTGLNLETYSNEHVLFEEDEIVRDKLLHASMLCHLAELGLTLARSYHQSDAAFWHVLQDTTAHVFETLRPNCEPDRWERERRALLETDWPVKSLLRMRLCDSHDDICARMPNPLAVSIA